MSDICRSTGKPCMAKAVCVGEGRACGGSFAQPGEPIRIPEGKVISDFSGLVDGTGYKASMDDPNKTPLWLVPVAFIRACGRALQHGAKKYAANNWRKGMKYSEVYSALQRHLGAWLEGEDNDPDSKLNHLDHACACLSFLTEYVANPQLYAEFDDRFKRPKV